ARALHVRVGLLDARTNRGPPMTTDLEQRLRESVTYKYLPMQVRRELREAADEIARLRAENEAFRKERETLAQNRRVNEAIQTTLEKGELHISSDGWLARQALQEGSGHE